MIVETSDNRLYAVTETGDAALAHVWTGVPVRRAKIRGTYERRANDTTPRLIRKLGSKVVSNFVLRD